jgi:hypothetical protein
MPNADRDQFPPEPEGERSDYQPRARSSGRRRKAVIGVTGLAAVLGVGAFVITDRLSEPSSTRDVAAISAPRPAAATSPAPSPTSPAPTPSPSASPSATSAAATVAEPDPEVSREIIAARSRAAADGVPLLRGLTSKALDSVSDVRVTSSGSPQAVGGTLKVVSARGDLTGYQELAWVGDDGEAVGDARCSQQFRLSNDVKATKRPTLLICWHTSAAKSVYTVALSLKSPPSKRASVAAIDQAWAQLS